MLQRLPRACKSSCCFALSMTLQRRRQATTKDMPSRCQALALMTMTDPLCLHRKLSHTSLAELCLREAKAFGHLGQMSLRLNWSPSIGLQINLQCWELLLFPHVTQSSKTQIQILSAQCRYFASDRGCSYPVLYICLSAGRYASPVSATPERNDGVPPGSKSATKQLAARVPPRDPPQRPKIRTSLVGSELLHLRIQRTDHSVLLARSPSCQLQELI